MQDYDPLSSLLTNDVVSLITAPLDAPLIRAPQHSIYDVKRRNNQRHKAHRMDHDASRLPSFYLLQAWCSPLVTFRSSVLCA
jgi:hypothetical protein